MKHSLEGTTIYKFDERQLLEERPWRPGRSVFTNKLPVHPYLHWMGVFVALGLAEDAAWGTLRN